MLTRVWLKLEYLIDVCRVTRGTHIEHLYLLRNLFSFPVVVNNPINVGRLVFLFLNVCNHGGHYETPCIMKWSFALPPRIIMKCMNVEIFNCDPKYSSEYLVLMFASTPLNGAKHSF